MNWQHLANDVSLLLPCLSFGSFDLVHKGHRVQEHQGHQFQCRRVQERQGHQV